MGTINEFYNKQYEDNIQMGAQQILSKFRDRCEVKTGVVGKSKAFGYVDKEDAREKNARHSKVVHDDPNNVRCTAYLKYKYKSIIQDPDDSLKVVADIKSVYARTPLAALNREMDKSLLLAARGTKYTGENGTTEEALPATSKIAAGGDGMTLAKIIATLEKFNDANVPEEEPKFYAIGPKGLTDLLNIEKLTSADYATLRALVPGKIVAALGFNFVLSTLLAKSGTTRYNIAWAQSGLGLAIGQDIVGRISELPEYHYAWGSYASMFIGATRVQDVKVVEIGSKEA